MRRDELVAAWKIFTPLLKYIDAGGLKPEMYPYGRALRGFPGYLKWRSTLRKFALSSK